MKTPIELLESELKLLEKDRMKALKHEEPLSKVARIIRNIVIYNNAINKLKP